MIYFTSDLHFGHKNIIEYCNRPFSSVERMNDCLVDNWNALVEEDDLVYVLGDVAMGKIAETLPIVSQLKGYKILVPGNHDRCWSGNKKVKVDIYQEVGFHIAIEQPKFWYGSNVFLLCHFPYHGDSGGEDRYLEFRPKDTGMPLLHGHVHDAWRVNGRMFNVGVDVNNFHPVSIDTIIKAMGLKED